MIDVYGLLSNIIEPICPCWVGHYPTDQDGEDNKIYPYVEINFPNILPNNTFSDNDLLEVDIWHNKDTDIREIEAIADSIHKELNFFNVLTDTFQLSINRNSPYRLAIPDSAMKIQRRQLRYVVKVYRK